MRSRVLGPQSDCASEAPQGLVAPILAHREDAQIEMAVGALRVDGERMPIVLHRFRRAAQSGKGIGDPDEAAGEARHAAGGGLIVAQGLRKLTGDVVQIAEIEVGSRKPRIAFDRASVRAAGLVEPGGREQHVPSTQMRSRIFRIRSDRGVIARQRLRPATLFLERDTLVDHRDRRRRARRCFLAICHGPLISNITRWFR